MDDIDTLELEAMAIKKPKKHRNPTTVKTIPVQDTLDLALSDFKAARALQKQHIQQAKQNIKSYKLLIRQAKTTYKLIKLQEQ